jgi:hypothetical protein
MTYELTLNFTQKQMDMLWHTRMKSFWPEQKDRFEVVAYQGADFATQFWHISSINHEYLNMFWLDTTADTFLFCAMLEQLNCKWLHLWDLAEDGSHCVLSDYQPK